MTVHPAARTRGGPAGRSATWFECTGCGWRVPPGDPVRLRCANASLGAAATPSAPTAAGDDVDHVLCRKLDPGKASFPQGRESNPFVRYRTLFHAWHAARELGWSDEDYVALVERLDAAVAAVDGHGFLVTPFLRAAELSDRLGFSEAGGVWVKDETANVSGSHKARHLMGTLLELEVAEGARRASGGPPVAAPPLAVASCGNAALAAAVIARAARRPLDVFIPPEADPAVVARLRELGARLTVCERRPGVEGDPTYHRLLESVGAGALAFSCQGNLNGLAVEGGETLGWEMADQIAAAGARLDRLVVQVGGGALAAACAGGLAEARTLGLPIGHGRFHAVQTRGAYPLERAHRRLAARVAAGERPDEALAYAAHHRSEFMWPWEEEPHSVAHGILDDETYDWFAVTKAMFDTGGSPIVVDEDTLAEANSLARSATGIDVDPTGSAGLAGLLHLVRERAVDPAETVAVLFTGVRRSTDEAMTPPSPAGGDRPRSRPEPSGPPPPASPPKEAR